MLARLERIEALDRAGAPASALLPELHQLVREAEAWARCERDPQAEAAVDACAAALGDAIVPV